MLIVYLYLDSSLTSIHTMNSIRNHSHKYPNIPKPTTPLVFKNFPNHVIEETSDFNTSNEEDEEGGEEIKSEINTTTSRLDRIRQSDGTIDLGLSKTDINYNKDDFKNKRRKMINYDTRQPVIKETREIISNDKPRIEYEIPFKFGDDGSNWRLMKLNKLRQGNKNPSDELIFQHYATIWDYQLACLEDEEIKERKFKSKSKWIYKPDKKFMNERRKHYAVNRATVKNFQNDDNNSFNNTSRFIDDKNVIEIKKPNVKLSKSQRLKNQLKLAHLTEMEYDNENGFSISRDVIESITDSP